MTSFSKNMYVDKWDALVSKYNKTYHSSTKMKPVRVRLPAMCRGELSAVLSPFPCCPVNR